MCRSEKQGPAGRGVHPGSETWGCFGNLECKEGSSSCMFAIGIPLVQSRVAAGFVGRRLTPVSVWRHWSA